ncbi:MULTISPECIES: DUF397 domain-containing protein [unclassified Streptomyces]|uniref:DUF397 domain-containing protein n=1 Tax=unclassified Streptomyces TaxID=2593676 RepID=UPI0027E5122D|nr:DUF397 domain-containing protein [Streptomyces sp. A 4/2]
MAPAAAWFPSPYSGAGNNCVEVADLTAAPHADVGRRDSKDPNDPALFPCPVFVREIHLGGSRRKVRRLSRQTPTEAGLPTLSGRDRSRCTSESIGSVPVRDRSFP